MPRGTRSVFTSAFGQKENFTVYFSGKRQSLLHPNTTQRPFFPITIFYQENVKKNWPEKRAEMLSEFIGPCSCPPGHPIILLKSN